MPPCPCARARRSASIRRRPTRSSRRSLPPNCIACSRGSPLEAGAGERQPVRIFFKPGIFGHHQVGRAADIYAVNGLGLDQWKLRWDEAMQRAAAAATPLERRLIAEKEEKENLGWRLYKALQRYGQWAQPYGYPVQLFGPWTRTEGPWKPISDFLLRAHRDHIHLAK